MDEKYMKMALAEARQALAEGEIPIGAVIVAADGTVVAGSNSSVSAGRVVARAHNLTECLTDVTAHAEMQAITSAAGLLGGKYLTDCTLYVTVEPCVMCAGAIGWAQIRRVVFGTEDVKRGFQTYAPRALHPRCEAIGGVLADECRQLMQDFFAQKRKGGL